MLTTLFLLIAFIFPCSWVWQICLWWRVWWWWFWVRVYHWIWFIWFVLIFLTIHWSCLWNVFNLNIFPLKNFSSFKFRNINMITVCCRFAHSFKTMARREPVAVQVFYLRTFQRLRSSRGGEVNVWFICGIEGREPKNLWTLDFRWGRNSQGSPVCSGPNQWQFHQGGFSHPFFNAKVVWIPFLGRRSVNGSVQWLNVPWPFGETGVATAAWTENTYVNPWCYVDSPAKNPDGDPINLCAVARRIRDDLLYTNCVDWFQNIQQETFTLCLSDTHDEVLSNYDWLKSDWSDWWFLNSVGNVSI